MTAFYLLRDKLQFTFSVHKKAADFSAAMVYSVGSSS